ncbi:PTS fructose transporter subunit IIC [Paenibacillus abyssi]|uniref:PTS fructose transporter subunit IIBC n=1 Tax=Paenibacillus abyssi TaxID=1340531 RepID=A0A917CYX6_9BACL|nr:fructose-specific PTS transporter subunit EIIC [Paenibacillus abyssi]GGG02694.1 PTS fructose transporter subunit IIBC [Paenibacillus abyssi]
MKKILAVTACPTGVAHTYMAAESLIKAAKANDISLKVETRGAVGVENEFTDQEIAEAHAIIVAADTDVLESRFEGKPVVKVPVAQAIKNPAGLLEEALNKEAAAPADLGKQVEEAKAKRSASRTGAYKHLMTGVSAMLPLVVAGGLLIAFSFFFGIDAGAEEGTIGAALSTIGGAAFTLMIPILAGFIAFSIAEKPGMAPGLIGGALAASTGAGFLGGIAAGFIAGYTAKYLKQFIKLPRNLEGLKPIMLIPLLASAITGLLMVYVVGKPVGAAMTGLTNWLTSLGSTNAILLGLLLGAMMAFDMGGPLNKAAYTFAVGLLASDIYGPMAAVMAAGMTPPLGLWLATLIAKNKFTKEEVDAGKAASVLGISFITEGAIPFAAGDPLRVIPSIMVGSAVTGALSMFFGATLRAPHGGIFVLPIPNAVGQLGMYFLAIVIGTVVTALMLALLKKPLVKN